MSEAYFNTHSNSTNVRMNSVKQRITYAMFEFFWRRMPGLTRRLALRIFFTPGPYRTNATEEACLKRGRPFEVQINNKIVKGWRWGQGPAILLVHGWSGRGIQFHGFIEPLVQQGYTAIAIDGPAHGKSSGRITSYFEFTDTVRSLLSENRNPGIQGIIAHSFGAAAVINALSKEALGINTVWIAPVLRLRELLFNTLDRLGIPRPLYTSLINEFEEYFGYSLKLDNPHRLVTGLFGSALIVHDENDRTVPFRDSEEQAKRHGNISLYATKGLGHRRILTDGQVIHRCVDHIGQLNPGLTRTA